MSIRTHLTPTLGATHLLMLDNATALGDGLPIAFDPLGGSFEGAKICEGISASYRASADKFQRGTTSRAAMISTIKKTSISIARSVFGLPAPAWMPQRGFMPKAAGAITSPFWSGLPAPLRCKQPMTDNRF